MKKQKRRGGLSESEFFLFARSVIRSISPRRLIVAALVAAILLAGLFALNAALSPEIPPGVLYVHFIDVGQGDAALLVTSDAAVLIDAGPTAAQYKVAEFVERYAGQLDLMILTHPHEDHIGGAAQVMRSVGVARAIMPDDVSSAGAFTRTLDAIEDSGVKVELAEAGAVYEFGALRLTLLAPLFVGHDDMNDDSVVVRSDYGERSFLFTGDAEAIAEREMLDFYPTAALDCDVLKVAHHGSSSSSSADFLAAVSPDIAVISVGAENDYGHPDEALLRRLPDASVSAIFRTDELGTVTLVCDGESVRRE